MRTIRFALSGLLVAMPIASGQAEPAATQPAIANVFPPPVTTVVHSQPCAKGCLNPVEAVTFASYLGDKAGVAGEFELTVRAVGSDRGRIFLNSETDYRDRNCLTVAIPNALAQSLFNSTDPKVLEQRLVGKSMVVGGIARRVRIDIIDDGKPTGKYYYQVHLPANSGSQFLRFPR